MSLEAFRQILPRLMSEDNDARNKAEVSCMCALLSFDHSKHMLIKSCGSKIFYGFCSNFFLDFFRTFFELFKNLFRTLSNIYHSLFFHILPS